MTDDDTTAGTAGYVIRRTTVPRLRILLAAAAGAGALVFGGAHAFAAGPNTDLGKDLAAAQSGEHATANDVDAAAELNVEDGQVGDVQEGQVGDLKDGQDETSTGQSGTTGTDKAGQEDTSTGQGGATGTTPPKP